MDYCHDDFADFADFKDTDSGDDSCDDSCDSTAVIGKNSNEPCKRCGENSFIVDTTKAATICIKCGTLNKTLIAMHDAFVSSTGESQGFHRNRVGGPNGFIESTTGGLPGRV